VWGSATSPFSEALSIDGDGEPEEERW
jgi:hypothetical protein